MARALRISEANTEVRVGDRSPSLGSPASRLSLSPRRIAAGAQAAIPVTEFGSAVLDKIPHGTSFCLISDFRGYEPKTMDTHMEVRDVLPRALVQYSRGVHEPAGGPTRSFQEPSSTRDQCERAACRDLHVLHGIALDHALEGRDHVGHRDRAAEHSRDGL